MKSLSLSRPNKPITSALDRLIDDAQRGKESASGDIAQATSQTEEAELSGEPASPPGGPEVGSIATK